VGLAFAAPFSVLWEYFMKITLSTLSEATENPDEWAESLELLASYRESTVTRGIKNTIQTTWEE
jgi:hypothetical protein